MTRDRPLSRSPHHIHASAVALEGRALLFSGPSGTGKTALALDMLALGCTLVADDTVLLSAEGGQLWASAAKPTRGLIEVRGLGLLPVEAVDEPVAVLAEVDLSRKEPLRLPDLREIDHAGVTIPLLLVPQVPNPAAALLQFLKAGRTLAP